MSPARPPADVCFLLEGTYPYVAGGVSSWVHDIITTRTEMTFHLVVMLASRHSDRTQRYPVPDNVTGITHILLQDPPLGSRFNRGLDRLARDMEPALIGLQSQGGLPDLVSLLRLLGPRRRSLGKRALLNSPQAWALLVRMYEAAMPEVSFLDYFWTWRSLMGGMFSVILSELPPARLYHAVSTGYAGLLAARARIETRRPVLLTEHGIYTNERRVEIAMADWLFDGATTGLGIEKPRRDLKDLWVDTFVSYSRACYAASDRIITLYTGNQDLQLRDGADPKRLEIVPNGIDYPRFSALPRDTTKRPPTIALIGRVVPIKDVKTYIRACAALVKVVPDLVALVLGPTEEDEDYFKECQTMVSHMGLEETVFFPGRVKLDEYLGKIDVNVLTSISEAQPLVILEAGAAGVPTVATDVGSCREMLLGRRDEDPQLGAAGAVTSLSSPAETASALAELLTNRSWWESCSRAIQARVRRYYNKVDVDATYRALYVEYGNRPDSPLPGERA